MSGPGRWVLLSYQMPREPSTPRVTLWRKLRRLGVAQLMDGLVALPLSGRNRERLDWLGEEIREAQGEAAIWIATPGSIDQEQRLVSRLQDAIAGEYAQIAEAARGAEQAEPAARRRTLARLRRELQTIRERDYFPTQAKERAIDAVGRLDRIDEVVM